MAEVIKYYERGEWKYATVKDIGEISELMTQNKSDIVSAINELYQSGGASSLPPDLEEKIRELEALTAQHSGSLSGIYTDLTVVKDNQVNDAERIRLLAIKEQEIREQLEEAQSELMNKANQAYVDAELATRVTGAELTTELSSKAGLSYVDSELAKKLSESKYQQEYLAIKAELDEKLDLTTHQENYDAIVEDIRSKADLSEFNGVKGRVSNVETSISNINGELEQKVSSVDYESDVGINKWLVTRFSGITTDMAQFNPEYSMLLSGVENETVEMKDTQRLLPEASNATIYRLFTNVYTSQAKTIGLTLSYQDSIHVLMNGASIYKNKANSGVGITASLSLRRGWNTVEILLGNKDGQPSIDFSTNLSTLVDKMTTVIGVGDRNEFRLKRAETSIQQNSEQIALSATKTEVSNLGNKIESAEAELVVQAGKIEGKVEQSTFNAYSQRLENAESTITQQADLISSKVSETEFNLLNGKVSNQETAINQMAGEISLKASQSSVNAISGKVDEAQAQLNIQAEQISTKVEGSVLTTELDKTLSQAKSYSDGKLAPISSRLSTAETDITQTKNDIQLRATKQEVDTIRTDVGDVVARVSTAETAISQNSDEIALRATKTELNGLTGEVNNVKSQLSVQAGQIATKVEGSTLTTELAKKEGSIPKGNTAPSNPVSGQMWLDTSGSVSVLKSWTGSTWKKATPTTAGEVGAYTKTEVDGQITPITNRLTSAETAINQTKDEIALKATRADVYTKSETDTRVGAKADQASLNTTNNNVGALTTRVGKAEADIKVNADGIALRATKSDLDNLTGRVSSAESSLSVQAGQIATKVAQSDFNTLSGKVSTAESTITQQASQIALRVEKSGVVSAINQSAESIKISASKIDIQGAVTFSSFDSTTQTKINSIEGTANTAKSTADSANSNANTAKTQASSAVTTANTASTNASNAVSTANTASSNANTAISTANTALTNANTAKDRTDEMFSDLKVTPLEKQELKRLWDSIKVEYAQIVAMANVVGSVATTNYTNAYNALNGTTPRIELDVLVSMTTTYSFASTSARDAFNNQFTTYFTQREALRKSINDRQKAIADGAQSTANTANSLAGTANNTANSAVAGANTALQVAKAMASGKLVREDVKFQTGFNGVATYNNASNGAVVVERVAKPNDAPTTSTHALRVTHTGAGSPSLGGFVQGISSRANAKFVVRYIINLPEGYSLMTASNSMGTGYTDGFIGSREGTGRYSEYIRVVECGATGTFSGGGHVYVNGATPTSANPLVWHIASIELYDVTDWEAVPESVSQSISTALTRTDEMFSDSKITPLEKQELLRMWDAIKIEYSQNIAMATALGSVATTNYTNAYNALNSTTPRIETDILSNMTVTYSFASTTAKNAFNDQIKAYYTQREALKKALTDRQKALSDNAQSTANTANSLAGTANNTANSAKEMTDELFSDLKVTPLEKQELRRLWDAIKLEYTQNIAIANAVGSVATTNYTNAYNALNSTTPRIELDVLASMTTTYTFASATARDTFRTQMNTYFTQREALKKATSDRQKALSDGAQSTANTANNLANTLNTLTSGWRHPTNTTSIDGGKIHTNTVTASQVSVLNLSALSANIGTITTGTISGVSFSSMPIVNRDYINRRWTEKTDISVGSVAFRTSATINTADNGGKTAIQETTLNNDGMMVFQRDDASGVHSFVSISGTNIQFGGATSSSVGVGQHFMNADGEFSLTSKNKLTLSSAVDDIVLETNRAVLRSNGEALRIQGNDHEFITFFNGNTRQGWIGQGSSASSNIDLRAERGHLVLQASGNIIVNSDVVCSSKLTARLSHSSGYMEVQSFNSSYGSGQAELWYRADQRQLTVVTRNSGDSGTTAGNLFADTMITNVLRNPSTGSISYLQVGSAQEVRVTQIGTTATYRPIRASSFITGSSIRFKDNLEALSYEHARYLVDSVGVFTYHLKSNLEGRIYDKPKIGLIAEMAPKEIRDEDGVDPYSMASTLWAVTRGHIRKIRELEAENESLRREMYAIDSDNDEKHQQVLVELELIKQKLSSMS